MTLVIRADASTEIGTGHVMRCLALAQAWMDAAGGVGIHSDVTFVCALLPSAMRQRLIADGCRVVELHVEPGGRDDVRQTLFVAREKMAAEGCPWVVVDGYQFDGIYQKSIREAGFKLLVIDDYNHLPEYNCDILLNQNIGSSEYAYDGNHDARRLMGPTFALLRREFGTSRPVSMDRKISAGEVPVLGKNILVTMGGADFHGMTAKTLRSLDEYVDGDPLHVRAVVGAAFQDTPALKALAANNHHTVEILQNVTDMPALISWADLVISAAGSTCWELMALGKPVMVVVLAENQERIAVELERQGYAVNLGWYHAWTSDHFLSTFTLLTTSSGRRRIMAEKGMALVDGAGALKVCLRMNPDLLALRNAVRGDARLLWEWANDSGTRMASFSSREIPWDEHCQWFEDRLCNERCRLLIAEVASMPVGLVRFERDSDQGAIVSVVLSPLLRGLGFGKEVIRRGTEHYVGIEGADKIDAYIKPENRASQRAFEHAGYKLMDHTTVKNQPALKFVWSNAA